MHTEKFDEEKEKIAYEMYMEEEGYIKVNGKCILGKYPNKNNCDELISMELELEEEIKELKK